VIYEGVRLCAALAILAACSPGQSADDSPSKPAKRVWLDAGTPGVTTIHGYDPASGMHLDEGGDHRPITPPASSRAARPIDVMLRSTPSGAQVSVDGVPLGYTPAYWPGQADGREHEFVFVLAGHATARYRFVPVSSGVIHTRLERIAEEPSGADRAPEGAPVPGEGSALVNPPPAPVAPKDASAPAPPSTVVSPPESSDGPGSAMGPQP
jgi:hypothetical protein